MNNRIPKPRDVAAAFETPTEKIVEIHEQGQKVKEVIVDRVTPGDGCRMSFGAELLGEARRGDGGRS